MAYENIIYGKEDGVATITINRMQVKNAISPQAATEIDDALDDAAADDEVKVVIITGGTETFCAGMDIKAGFGRGWRRDSNLITMVHGLETFEKPLIAAIAGYCLGGGLELALVCDLRICTNTTAFGFPEINMGVMPGAGGALRLPRLIGPGRAKELLLSGERIDAQEAYRIGIVNKVVPPELLMEETNKIASNLASKSLIALKKIKAVVNVGMQMDISSAVQFETQVRGALSAARPAAPPPPKS